MTLEERVSMPKILVLYHSRTGNTRLMAEAIEEGAEMVQGVEVELKDHAEAEELADFDAIVVGDPTYHHDMTRNIKKLFEKAAVKNVGLNSNVGATFGSYGWSAEAPALVLEIMNKRFGMDTIEPPLLIKYAPDQAGLQKCRQFGKKIGERLMQST
jgi:flavorubredoxin